MLTATIALRLALETAAVAPPVAESPELDLGLRTLVLLDASATAAKRSRYLTGSLGLVLGGAQFGLGLYAQMEFDDVLRRAGTGVMAGGGALMVTSALALASRTDIERIHRSADYKTLVRDPGDLAALARLHLRWAKAARTARISRRVFGAINLAGGLALAGVGGYFTFAARDDSERLLGLNMGGAGLGLTSTGIYSIVIPSGTEQAWSDYRKTTGLDPGRPRISIAPAVGGMTVHGRF